MHYPLNVIFLKTNYIVDASGLNKQKYERIT